MPTDFNQLRSLLESEQKRFTEQLEQLKAQIGELRQQGKTSDQEEEAMKRIELNKRLTLQKQIIDQLAEVEHALAKLEEGTYGLCDDCGQTIDPARLEVLPQANLCLSCKVRMGKARYQPRQREIVAYSAEKTPLRTIADLIEDVGESEPELLSFIMLLGSE